MLNMHVKEITNILYFISFLLLVLAVAEFFLIKIYLYFSSQNKIKLQTYTYYQKNRTFLSSYWCI